MDVHTYTWLAIWLATGLAALAGTVHIAATSTALADVRAWLRTRAGGSAPESGEHLTSTLEGQDHDDTC